MDLNDMNPVLLVAALTQQIAEQEKLSLIHISEPTRSGRKLAARMLKTRLR